MEYSEEELIKGCRENSRMMQEVVYRRYYSEYLKLCMRYTSCESDARHVLNDAFFKIFSKIDQYSWDAPFPAWMHRIVVNTCLDHVKQKMRRNKKETTAEESMFFPIATNEHDHIIGKISFQEIIMLIQELPDKHRTVFNLSVFEGMTHKEIAKELDMSHGTSQWYLSKAKELLRTKLSPIKKEVS